MRHAPPPLPTPFPLHPHNLLSHDVWWDATCHFRFVGCIFAIEAVSACNIKLATLFKLTAKLVANKVYFKQYSALNVCWLSEKSLSVLTATCKHTHESPSSKSWSLLTAKFSYPAAILSRMPHTAAAFEEGVQPLTEIEMGRVQCDAPGLAFCYSSRQHLPNHQKLLEQDTQAS